MNDDDCTAEDQLDHDAMDDGLDAVPMSTRAGCFIMFAGVALLTVLARYGKPMFALLMGE